jgi:hypothetical protein
MTPCFFVVGKEQPKDHFFNYRVSKSRLEIQFYRSYRVDEMAMHTCPRCMLFQSIIENEMANAYQTLLREIVTYYHNGGFEGTWATSGPFVAEEVSPIKEQSSPIVISTEPSSADLKQVSLSFCAKDIPEEPSGVGLAYSQSLPGQPSQKPVQCIDICTSLRDILSIFYNVKVNQALRQMKESQTIDPSIIYIAAPEQTPSARNFYIFPLFTESIVIPDLKQWSKEFFLMLKRELADLFLQKNDLFLVDNDPIFLMRVTIDTSAPHNDFVIHVSFYSEARPEHLQLYQKKVSNIRDLVESQILKDILKPLERTNTIRRNPVFTAILESVLRKSEVKVQLPMLKRGRADFLLEQNHGKKVQKNGKFGTGSPAADRGHELRPVGAGGGERIGGGGALEQVRLRPAI